MNSKQKEAVRRITAQYVAEVHAGHKPKVSTYIARYPQYASEIADFVAYFHAFEEDIPEGACRSLCRACSPKSISYSHRLGNRTYSTGAVACA